MFYFAGAIHCVCYLYVLLKIGDAKHFPPDTIATKASWWKPETEKPYPHFWLPNVTFNGAVHKWTYYNGTWNDYVPNESETEPEPSDTYFRVVAPAQAPAPAPAPSPATPTPYPIIYYQTDASDSDPGWFNTVELGVRNRMYELRGVLHYHFPRYSIFQFKRLVPKITLQRHNRYFEGPAHYGLFALAFATSSIIIVIAYLLSIRCWGITYPFLTMSLLRCTMVLVASMIIFFLLIGLSAHIMIWHCFHTVHMESIQGPTEFLTNFVDRVGECVKSVYDYLLDLEKKLVFIKASLEGEVNPYLTPDDMLITTTVGPNLKDDMQNGGWQAVYERIVGARKEKVSPWSKVANSISAKVWGITNDLKLMSALAHTYLTTNVLDKLEMLEAPMQGFLDDIKTVLKIAHWFKTIDYVLTTVGFLFFGYMIFLCFCIIRTTTQKKNRKMRCLSKFTICMMIFWWLITIIIIPMAFIWVDLCFHPAETISLIIGELVKFEHSLIFHYLTCRGRDPFEHHMKIIILGLGYVMRAMGLMLAGVQSFGRNSERVVDIDEGAGHMIKIQHAQLEIFKTISSGCNRSALLFGEAMILVCNPCLMGVILLATIAPIIATLFLFVVLLSLKMKNFIGLPIPGVDWKKLEKAQAKRKKKWQKKQEKKLRKMKARDEKLRRKMAAKMAKKAIKADLDSKMNPVKFLKKKRKLLRKQRLKEIKRLKKLAACFCVPPFMTGKKCPDECRTVPTDLPPISDPRERQLELKKLIKEDKMDMKEDLRLAKIQQTIDAGGYAAKRKQMKKQAKDDAKKEKKRRKKLKKKLKKLKEADDGDVDARDLMEDEEERKQLVEASKKCDITCRGIDKLKAMRDYKKALRLKRAKHRGGGGGGKKSAKPASSVNKTGCLEEQCIISKHAKDEVEKALKKSERFVDLECGCKFETKDLKRRIKSWFG